MAGDKDCSAAGPAGSAVGTPWLTQDVPGLSEQTRVGSAVAFGWRVAAIYLFTGRAS
ncbi:MAG: hypothetical protein M5U22_06760 [Thermoleophilia bacterium]|nr:hypothetical protein [Thermoleophilia bacterium]